MIYWIYIRKNRGSVILMGRSKLLYWCRKVSPQVQVHSDSKVSVIPECEEYCAPSLWSFGSLGDKISVFHRRIPMNLIFLFILFQLKCNYAIFTFLLPVQPSSLNLLQFIFSFSLYFIMYLTKYINMTYWIPSVLLICIRFRAHPCSLLLVNQLRD